MRCVQSLAQHCTWYHLQLSLKCLTDSDSAPPSHTLPFLLTKGARAMLHCGVASGFLLTVCECLCPRMRRKRGGPPAIPQESKEVVTEDYHCFILFVSSPIQRLFQ